MIPPPPSPREVLDGWITTTIKKRGRHRQIVVSEKFGARDGSLDGIVQVVKGHYVSNEILAAWFDAHGAPEVAILVREHLPIGRRARSGDCGEVLATELVEYATPYRVPIRRLRWKDGRDMALRGDDVVGVKESNAGRIDFLKGESKSRATLSKTVVDQAYSALDASEGRPSRHSVLFVAARLRELGEQALATSLELAVLDGFRGRRIEHVLAVFCGNDPAALVQSSLTERATSTHKTHVISFWVPDHPEFITAVYGRL